MMPFPGGVEAISNGTLIFSIGAAVFYLVALRNPPSSRRTVVKTLSVAFLALLATIEGGPWLLVAALVVCAVGDAFLSYDGDRPFLAGLGSFLVGHLIYIALFAAVGKGPAIALHEPLRVLIAVLMLAAASILLIRLRATVPGDMRLAVTLYAMAILAMGLMSLTVPGAWIALGAVCFMASDALLGTEKFLLQAETQVRTSMRYAVWVLYYAAQAIITLGLLLGTVQP